MNFKKHSKTNKNSVSRDLFCVVNCKIVKMCSLKYRDIRNKGKFEEIATHCSVFCCRKKHLFYTFEMHSKRKKNPISRDLFCVVKSTKYLSIELIQTHYTTKYFTVKRRKPMSEKGDPRHSEFIFCKTIKMCSLKY